MFGKAPLAERWARGERDAIKEVERLLKQAGLGQDAIAAETLVANLGVFEKIDGMVMRAEARRNVVLRELGRRRDVAARRLRELANEIEEAELREISGKAAAE